MAVNPYETFHNAVSGESFRCISSIDEAYIAEWIVQPSGFVPFAHTHPTQDEVFHVREGEMRVLVNGREQIVRAGQTVIVPKGAKHRASNNSNGLLVCTLEYRPGLDSYKTFQCFGGLCIDGDMTPGGIPHPLKMLYFLSKMKAQALVIPSYTPTPLFLLGMKIFLVVGTLLGWEKLYKKYTGGE